MLFEKKSLTVLFFLRIFNKFIMIYHLWNSEERVRNYNKKYVAEVPYENIEQFNYYMECVSDENKRIQTTLHGSKIILRDSELHKLSNRILYAILR